MKILLRPKYDDNGNMVGFHAGGPNARGISKKNLNKFYKRALILGGLSLESAKKYSYHGGKRAGVTFQKSFGNTSDSAVAVGTKHRSKGIIAEYTDATKAQLSEPGKRLCDLREKMRFIKEAKEEMGERTPPRALMPGEVGSNKGEVSPSEVRKFDSILAANGMPISGLQEVGEENESLKDSILKFAASKVVGQPKPLVVNQEIGGGSSKLSRKVPQFPQWSVTPNFQHGMNVYGHQLNKYAQHPFGQHEAPVYRPPAVYNNCTFNFGSSFCEDPRSVNVGSPSSQRLKKRRKVVEEIIEESN